GPEGIALFYCRSEWLQRLDLKQFGWHMVQAMGDYDRRDWQPAGTARRFECGSPNMLGIHALHTSLALILQTGIESIFNLVSLNIQYLIDNIKISGGEILSETRPEKRAGIMAFRLKDEDLNARYRHLQEHGVICALRAGAIRFSPHFYTPRAVLERALTHATEPLKN
ncbi:MAG TPA: aminotransferase class V-fold PLP-dependent enzyme, partial [Gammaproteobacteria bacterium]|nr:aminotransferase class V-fold PLP-dependent enzyme [Gammaproteobacteria bacterium]